MYVPPKPKSDFHMTTTGLRVLGITIVAAQWLLAIFLATTRKRSDRSAIRFVISDLTFLAFFAAFGSTFWLVFMLLDSKDTPSYFVGVIATPLMMLLIYLPSSLFPVDLLARLIYGRPNMTCVSLFQAQTISKEAFRIAHLSDLHLTDDLTVKADFSRSRVQRIVSGSFNWAIERTDAIFLTGDITDQGRPGEWDLVLDVIASQGFALHEGCIFLVPGNHDLSLVTHQQLGASSQLSYDRHAHTFITKILTRCPQQWMMLSETGLISVRSYLESVADYLACYDNYPPFARSFPVSGGAVLDIWFPDQLIKAASRYKGSLWPSERSRMCHDFLRMAYPMVMLDDDRYLIIGLNSCDETPETLINSGFGRLGRKQISRFESLVRDAGARCVIVLLHHHVGIPSQVLAAMRRQHSRIEIRALALRDAYRLARVLGSLKKCIVFHGHKHIGYQAILGSATVIAGPSVTYGNEFGGSNCSIYAIDDNGNIAVMEDSPFSNVLSKVPNEL